MVEMGHQGYCRFSMFQNELVVGQIGFGENSLYPTSFDGPGGSTGVSPAAPFLGSRERKLKKGDLVFIDIGYAVNGYNSDKTQVYMFGAKPAAEVLRAHRACVDMQSRAAEMMKPGAIPAEIYNTLMDSLSEEFKQNFMGFGRRQVKFLGSRRRIACGRTAAHCGRIQGSACASYGGCTGTKKGVRGNWHGGRGGHLYCRDRRSQVYHRRRIGYYRGLMLFKRTAKHLGLSFVY